ncbi:MAG: pseudouridine synthase [Lachnospiraceae bacterium]|nr:pseudouridine synthase [Lachnospiraceae bacterium]
MDKQDGIRINKYIADAGICSRRKADELVENGKVAINGSVAANGSRVFAGDVVTVNGEPVKSADKKVYLALNKPKGITCTADSDDPRNVIDFISYPVRLTYCGRLDKDSEGLLILTNDGEIINRMMKAANYHEKEYIVTVDRKVTPGFLRQLSEGVYLEELDETTRPCVTEATKDPFTFKIILTQGLNRQIRRMCEALGFHVRSLKRVRIMNIMLGDLREGRYRPLNDKELMALKKALKMTLK